MSRNSKDNSYYAKSQNVALSKNSMSKSAISAAPAVIDAGVIAGDGVIGVSQTVVEFNAYTNEGTLSYSWKVDDVEVATTAAYVPQAEDENGELTRTTTVTNSAGAASGTTPSVTVQAA